MTKCLGVVTMVSIQHPQNGVKEVIAEVNIKIVATPSTELTNLLNDLKDAAYPISSGEILRKVALDVTPKLDITETINKKPVAKKVETKKPVTKKTVAKKQVVVKKAKAKK